MWLAEKSAGKKEDAGECVVGVVTIGGARPSVLAEGELRSAELLQPGTARLPKTGDEVLLVRTADGDCIALGRVGGAVTNGAKDGDTVLCSGDGSIVLKNGGEIILTGDILLKGTVNVEGTLLINGQAYVPPSSSGTTGTTSGTTSGTTTGA